MKKARKTTALRLMLCSLAVSGISITALPRAADAAILQYDLVGDMHAPLYWYKDTFSLAKWYPSGGYFHLFLNPGDVVLTYDDRDTASTLDDVVRIQGQSRGCVGDAAAGNCGADFKSKSAVWGVYKGSGDFEWDLTFENPIAALTEDGQQFAFDEQQAGTITLLNGGPAVPATIDVMLKRDKDFAFQLFPDLDGDQIFLAEGWLAMTGGVLGKAGARGEHGPNNSRLNWDLKLIRHGDAPPPPPPGEPVPEPASLVLLASGLAAMKRRRKTS